LHDDEHLLAPEQPLALLTLELVVAEVGVALLALPGLRQLDARAARADVELLGVRGRGRASTRA
jgi:hypothetical protein